MTRLSIVVPAYNEVRAIRRTLAGMQSYLARIGADYQIIVAADGDDGTRELVSELARGDERLKVIGTATRGGKGRAVRSGLVLTTGDIVGFVDADGKTPIEELGKLLPWFDRGFDLVTGSRAMADSSVEVRQPRYRRIGSRGFALVLHSLIDVGDVRDTQCGFKFFRANAAREIFARQQIDGYMFDVEILAIAKQLELRVKEVGIRWLDDGDSRYDPIAGTLDIARDLLRIRSALRLARMEGHLARSRSEKRI